MNKAKKWGKWSIAIGIACIILQSTASAEEFVPGGTAATPAIAAYETWMQFEAPNTNTPAIDEDGCLNYALAKMAVRYNLPVPGVDILTDSYTYYTTFSESVLQSGMSKMQRIDTLYADYLTCTETTTLSGNAADRMAQAYTVCAENGSSAEWSYILQMTTASGSDHYVLVDYVDTESKRLYLLDSGSWYIDFLGDAKTMEKGYYITTIYPIHIKSVPGDVNSDKQLTAEDVTLLLEQNANIDVTVGDANHDGTVDTTDVVYLAHAVQYQAEQTIQCVLQSDGVPLPVATATTQTQKQDASDLFASASRWNDQTFQNQLAKIK